MKSISRKGNFCKINFLFPKQLPLACCQDTALAIVDLNSHVFVNVIAKTKNKNRKRAAKYTYQSIRISTLQWFVVAVVFVLNFQFLLESLICKTTLYAQVIFHLRFAVFNTTALWVLLDYVLHAITGRRTLRPYFVPTAQCIILGKKAPYIIVMLLNLVSIAQLYVSCPNLVACISDLVYSCEISYRFWAKVAPRQLH